MTTPATGDEATQALREQLRNEVNGLKAFAVPWRGENRSVRVGTKILVGLGVGGML
jgi:CDP-diacylglycerol---glycerol-3-phosphate 3-phosphatidyltransferase